MKVTFYFQYQEHGKDHIVEVKECKRPRQTAVYKMLCNNLDRGFIYSYGYKTEENE
jgi:hypothetical protein